MESPNLFSSSDEDDQPTQPSMILPIPPLPSPNLFSSSDELQSPSLPANQQQQQPMNQEQNGQNWVQTPTVNAMETQWNEESQQQQQQQAQAQANDPAIWTYGQLVAETKTMLESLKKHLEKLETKQLKCECGRALQCPCGRSFP